MIDYHIHSSLCRHAEGELNEYIEHAITSGIREIAVTDHIPLPNKFDLAHRMNMRDIETYLHWIDNARMTYPEIIIRSGIEADYIKGYEDFLGKFLASYKFDVVLMSIHFIGHWKDGNWVFNYSFPERDREDIFNDYINEMIAGIKTGLFDVVAHVDLLKKPGESFIKLFPEKVDQLLTEIKKSDMALEINSSGFRKEVGESFPGIDWLNALHTKEVPVCTGSDAHKPGQVGFNFEYVYDELKKHGFSFLACFEDRRKFYQAIT